MKDLVVLVEERSAKIVIDALARRFAPTRRVIVASHEGKSVLEKSFPRKIRAWRHPGDTLFLVVRDNDGGNCRELKGQLALKVPPERRDRTRIRIVVQCLEAWYLGDLPALAEAAFIPPARVARLQNDARYRDPDEIGNPAEIFQKLIGRQAKLATARALAPLLDPARNRSRSFKALVQTLVHFEGQ